MSIPFPWGKTCEVCGKAVHPPSNVHEKAAQILNDRIWHGRCFPEGGVSGTFSTTEGPRGERSDG